MKIVTADVELDLGYCRIAAHVPTVVADGAAIAIRKATAAAGLPLRISGMGHYTRHYCGQDLAGKCLLVWRGCGLGDQLMASAVIRGILDHYPTALIVMYSDPRVYAMLWQDSNPPCSMRPEPIPLRDWLSCDYHLVLADMCEADSEPGQGHTVDRMLWAAGFDPALIGPLRKLPYVPVTNGDRVAALACLASACGALGSSLPRTPTGMAAVADAPGYRRIATAAVAGAAQQDGHYYTRPGPEALRATAGDGGTAGLPAVPATPGVPAVDRRDEGSGESATPRRGLGQRPFVLWQLGASTPIRSYRPDLARRAMELLLAARPGLDILATGTAAEFAAYEPLPQGVIRVRGQKLRTVFALCLQAVCTVAPDSVMVHAAGGLRRPCVGLWGSFSPRWRASYYPEHRALVGEAPCAPCATHECGAQEEGCPRRMGRPADDRYCEAIAGIAPETVVAAVLEIAG